jgi:hypothetical protein
MNRNKFIEKTRIALNFKEDCLDKLEKEISDEEKEKEIEIIEYLKNVLKHIDRTVAYETIINKKENICKEIQKWKAESFGVSLDRDYAITIREELLKCKAKIEIIDEFISNLR